MTVAPDIFTTLWRKVQGSCTATKKALGETPNCSSVRARAESRIEFWEGKLFLGCGVVGQLFSSVVVSWASPRVGVGVKLEVFRS